MLLGTQNLLVGDYTYAKLCVKLCLTILLSNCLNKHLILISTRSQTLIHFETRVFSTYNVVYKVVSQSPGVKASAIHPTYRSLIFDFLSDKCYKTFVADTK